jgi:hypothetical protein
LRVPPTAPGADLERLKVDAQRKVGAALRRRGLVHAAAHGANVELARARRLAELGARHALVEAVGARDGKERRDDERGGG